MIRIEADDLSRSAVLALIEEHLRNMFAWSPPEYVSAFDVNQLKDFGVTLWTAWNGETLLGCAGLKELSVTMGEIKSMCTSPAARRTGVARLLLNRIVQTARVRGYARLYLETGSHPGFLPAHQLYRSAGFTFCGTFASYVENDFSVFMSLALDDKRG